MYLLFVHSRFIYEKKWVYYIYIYLYIMKYYDLVFEVGIEKWNFSWVLRTVGPRYWRRRALSSVTVSYMSSSIWLVVFLSFNTDDSSWLNSSHQWVCHCPPLSLMRIIVPSHNFLGFPVLRMWDWNSKWPMWIWFGTWPCLFLDFKSPLIGFLQMISQNHLLLTNCLQF